MDLEATGKGKRRKTEETARIKEWEWRESWSLQGYIRRKEKERDAPEERERERLIDVRKSNKERKRKGKVLSEIN